VPILTPEERVGTTLAGKYRLDRILATGGMATVFTGVHAWTERSVAVKILNYEHARDPEVVRRFLQEARAAAQLKHPNVVDVLDMGQDDDGTVFLVLELLEGETLKALLKRGVLAPHEAAILLAPILRAVAAAHAKGVVHRDLKPDNIFLALGPVGPDGHRDTIPKLLDFGIAKVANEGDSGSTRTGAMVGTPQYMSPEQVRGDRELGPRADVWSMGVLLHYALTKRMPFNAESAPAVLARVLTERARPIREIAPTLPEALAAVIDRALQHEASARFADMREMALAFEAAVGLSSPREPSMVLGATPLAYGMTAPSGASLPPAVVPTSDIAITPTKILEAPPIPVATAPSEYPPSSTTPYAWGTPPATVETPARDRRPLFAAMAAVLVLVGVVSAWAMLEVNRTEPPTASLPPISVPATRPSDSTVTASPPPLPASATSPSAPSAAAEVTVPATDPSVEASAVVVEPPTSEPAVAPAAEPPVTEASDDSEAPSAAEPPTASSPRTATSSERPPRARREDGTTERADSERDPERDVAPRTARTAPARGTGGAIILRDDDTEGSGTAPPRRGTGGALILH
jgi:serine/threonine-protein kinase